MKIGYVSFDPRIAIVQERIEFIRILGAITNYVHFAHGIGLTVGFFATILVGFSTGMKLPVVGWIAFFLSLSVLFTGLSFRLFSSAIKKLHRRIDNLQFLDEELVIEAESLFVQSRGLRRAVLWALRRGEGSIRLQALISTQAKKKDRR